MWIRHREFRLAQEAYSLTLGRSLIVAQAFEQACNRTLLYWDAAREIGDGDVVDLHEMARHPEGFMEDVLGRAVKRLASVHKIREDDVDVLEKARKARNYVAHHAARPYFAESSSEKAIAEELGTLDLKIQHLGKALDMLERWGYEFEEGEPAPAKLVQGTSGELRDWVLGPLEKALQAGCSLDT